MAVDVLMGALVFARGLCGVHTARAASHWREFYVRFVVRSCLSHRDSQRPGVKCGSADLRICGF